MKIVLLEPRPQRQDAFRRNRERFIPNASGCYALATYDDEVLYVGLTIDLRRRFNEHLDDPVKTSATIQGRASWFYWYETSEINKVERTWLNIHIQYEGKMPILNQKNSPTST